MNRVSLCAVAWFTASTLVSIELLELHGPDGQTVFVNAHEISSLREPLSKDLHQYFAKSTHCVLVTTNGKFIAVKETCRAIRDMLSERHVSIA